MRYTRGWKSFGDRRAKFSTLAISEVSIQKDSLEGLLRSIEITDGDREGIQHELHLAGNRWGIEGNKSGIGPIKRPLLTSTEWVQIQEREMIGRSSRNSVGKEKQWVLLEQVGFLFRRPVRGDTEEQRVALKQRSFTRAWGFGRRARSSQIEQEQKPEVDRR